MAATAPLPPTSSLFTGLGYRWGAVYRTIQPVPDADPEEQSRKGHAGDASTYDEFFGWRQAERAKVQQLAYAGARKRSERAKVTMMT